MTRWKKPPIGDTSWSTIALASLRKQVTGPTSLQSARRVQGMGGLVFSVEFHLSLGMPPPPPWGPLSHQGHTLSNQARTAGQSVLAPPRDCYRTAAGSPLESSPPNNIMDHTQRRSHIHNNPYLTANPYIHVSGVNHASTKSLTLSSLLIDLFIRVRRSSGMDREAKEKVCDVSLPMSEASSS
ncbi:hypothetical protein AAG570_002618 [Ranatra chinensis]|uniref:Uncharacterized protein n=1 Tax=Ranatra chinensis TaxID=642074 RepID=A0ABD0Y841_9HEMI